MKNFIRNLLISAMLLPGLSGCNSFYWKEARAYYQAVLLSETISPGSLDFAYKWNYTDLGSNGNVGIWTRFDADTISYFCDYTMIADTQKIRCENLNAFYTEFPVAVDLKKEAKYQALEFAIVGDMVRVSGVDYLDEATFIKAYRKGDLFRENDPATHFKKLQQWKRELGIDGVRCYHSYGNYLVFDLPGNYEAVYLPNDLWVKEEFQPEFNDWMSRGAVIGDNWRFFYTGGLDEEN